MIQATTMRIAPPKTDRPSLTHRVVHAGAWMGALNLTARLAGTARLLILARLLSPHDFGIFGVALAMLSLFQSLSGPGLHLAIIHHPVRTKQLYDTAWTLGLCRGVLMTGLLFVCAPTIGDFFGAPEAVNVVRVVALVPLIESLTSIGVVEFRKDLSYGPYYLYHISGVLADLCIAVPLAFWFRNAWALVGGWLALKVTQVITSYCLHPYRPVILIERRYARELFGYGRWVLGSAAITWLITDGVPATVGRLLGVQSLGYYQMAWRFASLPTTEMTQVVAGVTVAAYAELQHDAERTRLAYRRVFQAVSLAAVPVTVGIAVFGRDLVQMLLGAQWLAVTPVIRLLAVLGFVRSVGSTTIPLFQGTGKPRAQTLVSGVELVLLVTLIMPFTGSLRLPGTAVAATVAAVAGTGTALWVAHRCYSIQLRSLLSILIWPLLACVPFALIRLWALGAPSTLAGLMGQIGLSGALYGVILMLLHRLTCIGWLMSSSDARSSR